MFLCSVKYITALIFGRFEILASLAYLEAADKGDIEAALADPARRDFVWVPVGRSGLRRDVRDRLIKEIQSESMTGALLDAGFARGSKEHLDLSLANFSRIAGKMSW